MKRLPTSAGPVAGNRTRKLQGKPGQRGLCLFLPLAIPGERGWGGHTRAGEDSSYLDTNCDRLPPLSSLTAMPHPLHRAAVGLAEHGCLEALQPVTAMVLLFLLRRARHRCGTALSLCSLWCDCCGHLEFLGAQVGHVPAPPRLWGDYSEQIPCLPQGLLFWVYSGAGGN